MDKQTRGLVEELKEYYLVSEGVFISYPLTEYSKPLERYGGDVRIAILDFDDFKDWYEALDDETRWEEDIYAQEITRANTTDFDILELDNTNLFEYLCESLGVSTEKNVAALIGEMANEMGVTPIEFFNYIHDKV